MADRPRLNKMLLGPFLLGLLLVPKALEASGKPKQRRPSDRVVVVSRRVPGPRNTFRRFIITAYPVPSGS